MKKQSERKRISPLRILTLVLSCSVFLFAAVQLFGYFQEEQASSQSLDDMAQQAVSVVTPATQPPEPSAEDAIEASTAPTLPAVSYEIPIRVDFALLREEGPDIVGWLYGADTPINNPVVQGDDNEYYVNRLPDGTTNANGSLFMDYRNLPDLSDRNTIVYGHNMKSGKMFGSLNKYRTQSYYDTHPVLWLLTPEQAYRIDLIAGMVTPSDSDTYEVFSSDEEFRLYLEEAVARSTFVSNVDIAAVDRIIILSTCSYEYATARYVLVGALTPAPYPPEAEVSDIQ
ncbi:MAG: class B sortase [Oscillospiraceae bacterium]|nr:class B sortase [Oscillospiraceae bacterium]MBQ7129800.1 class B sortase [Oscillospiraceae bacterium]